jgi:hypothetical protein
MELLVPRLRFDLQRDAFVVWLRWVELRAGTEAASPAVAPPPEAQGIRVELQLNRNAVLGPTIVRRTELEAAPLYLRANRARTAAILRALRDGAALDVTLVIHGSVAHAPYAALFHVRDHDREAIDTRPLAATPLLQLQPSTPPDRWHVAGQANLRVEVELSGRARHLDVLRG